MAWWEKLFEPMPTGNLVGDTLSAINGSPAVSAARSEAGSFDPNKIKMAMPESYREGVAPYVETLTGLANQRQAAIEQAYKMPDSTWMQGLGRALSAISVPVGYAQGSSYGPAMLGRTEQDIYNRRSDAYQDRLNAARAQGVDSLYSGLGQSAVDYISKTNERTREARLQAARILAAARRTGDPRAIAEAEALAKQLMEAQGVSATTGGSAVAKSAIGAPAAAAGSASTGAAPTGVPGTVMTPPTGAPPAEAGADVEIGMPSMAAPPPPAAGSVEDLARYKRAQAAYLMEVDPKAADALVKEAERLEEPGQKGKIKFQEKRAEAEAENTTKAKMGATLKAQMGQYISEADRILSKPGVDYYIGPIQGGVFGRYVGDSISALDPGNESGPADRAELESLKNNMVQLLKPYLRVPGEGSQDQREFQSIIDSVGDLTAMPTAADAKQLLGSLQRRISVMLSKYGPPEDVPNLTERISVTDDKGNKKDVPSIAGSSKDAPLGTERNLNGKVYVKTDKGWVEKPREAAANWQEAY